MLRREFGIVSRFIIASRYIVTAIFGCLFFLIPAEAATTTWIGANNGSWNTASNWDTGIVPTANDDVVIASTTFGFVRAPFNGAGPTVGINFKSLTLSTTSLILYGYGIISGGDITINESAMLSLQVAEQKQVISGNLTVSGTLQTDVNTGTFFPLRFRANNIFVTGNNATVKAYGSGYTANGAGVTGSGPGGGLGSGAAGGGGGGHYGAGGDGAGAAASGGASYCNLSNPLTYGSAGGGGLTGSGGRGGGLIVLEAYNTTTFSGGNEVTAAGEIGTNWGGGGAGGSISLTTRNLVFSSSQFYIDGGSGGTLGGGGGGGGCALVKYVSSNNLTTSSIFFSGGTSGVGAATGSPGGFLIQQISSLVNPPTTPTSTSNISSNTIRYSWTGGGGLENYFVLDRSTDGVTYSFVTTSNISASTSPTGTFFYDFTSLSPNQRYWFRVAAGDAVDATSTYATSSPVYTLAQTVNAPTVTVVATTSLQLTLDTASNPSTTLYALFNTTTQNYVTASGTVTGTPTYFTSSSWGGQVTGLTASTSYRFVVIPRNGDGINSATSSASTATTTLSAIVPNTPSLTVSNPTTTTLQLTLNTNSNSSTTLYALYNTTTASYIDATGNYSATPVYFTSTTWNNGNAQGLATDTPYSFVVIAQSTDQIFVTSSPTAVSYTRPASGSITPLTVGTSTVSFAFVTNGNPSTTRYSIFYSSGSSIYLTPSGTVSTTAQFFTSSSWQNIPLQNLTPSTTYTFFINTVGNPSNLFQSGSASQITTTTLPVPLPNTPGAPEGGAVTSSSLQLSFSSTTTNGNPATTTYAIYITNLNRYVDAAGVTTSVAVFQVSSSWSGITVQNLLPITSYGFRAIAYNGQGQVTSTLATTLTTGPAMLPAPTLAIGTSTVQVTVNVGDNAYGTSNLFLRIVNLTDGVFVTASGTATTTAVFFNNNVWNNGTVTGLNPNTAYQFALVPLNGNFVSAPTTTFSFTTQAVISGSGGSGGGSTVTYGGGGGGGSVYYFAGSTTTSSSATSTVTSTPLTTSTPITSSASSSASGSSSIAPFSPGWVFPTVGNTGVVPVLPLTPVIISPIQFFNIPVTPVQVGQSFSFRYTAQNTTTLARTVRIERVLINSRGTILTRATALILQRPGQVFTSSPRVTLGRALPAGVYTIRVRVLTTAGRVLVSNSFPLTVRR